MNKQVFRSDKSLLSSYWVLMILSCFALTAFFGALGHSFVPAFLALLLFGLCLFPTMRHNQEHSRDFPIVPIMAGAIAIQYSVPALLGDRTLMLVGGPAETPEDALIVALCLAIAGTVTFIAASYSKILSGAVSHLPTINLHLNRRRALIFCIVVVLISLFSSSIFSGLSGEEQGQFSALIRVLQNQLLAAIAILSWLVHTGAAPWVQVTLYSVIGLAASTNMSWGSLEGTVAPLGVLFACQWIYGHRVNKALLLLLVAFVLFLNPAKSEFREQVWAGSMTNASAVEKVSLWIGAAASYWLDVAAGQRDAEEAKSQLVKRVDLIDLLAHVIDFTPENTPYLDGETYNYFIYALIPRAIWAGKPTATANKTLAVAYELATELGAETSTFGIGLLAEGYANFGWVGVLLISFVLGLVLLAMQRLFGTERSGPGGPALLLAFFVFFVNGLGSSAEIVFGNVFQSLFMSFVAMYWVTEKRGLVVPVIIRSRTSNS